MKLVIIGLGVMYLGWWLLRTSLYPTGQKYPLRDVLSGARRWPEERLSRAIGGAAIMFAGAIILYSI
jgi:hypothetical protein